MVSSGESWDDEESLSAEDLATLDGIWKTSSGDPVGNEAVTALAVPVRPEIPEAAPEEPEAPDLEAAKALLDESDGAGVFPWRSASREQIAAQWQALREFVDWAVVAYRITGSEHNPCWWAHSNVVLEWTGLRHLYDLSWTEEDSGGGPNNFHYWLQATRSRLHGAWSSLRCSPTEHVEPRALGAAPTVIEDEEWARLTGASDEYKAPEQWPMRDEYQAEPGTADEAGTSDGADESIGASPAAAL